MRQNPIDNVFNSTRSRLGSPVSVAGDLPQLTGGPASMSGVDLDVLDITANLKAGDTQLAVEAETSGDEVFLGGLLTSITSVRPVLSGSAKTFVNLTRSDGRTLPGDQIEYTLTVSNAGSDGAVNVVVTDALPTQVTFVPGSLRVLTGPNTGNKTDAVGDDQAEYVAGTRTVVARLGTGATGTQGGTMTTTDGPSSLAFRVTVNAGAMGLVSNQATISGQGQTATAQGNTEPSTWPTGNGSGPGIPTVFQISTCATSNDCPISAPVCDTSASPPQCVCRMDSDCPSGTICNAVSKICTQCSATNTTNCLPTSTGGACLPGGVCGCNTNTDCGGRTCDQATKTCPAVSTDLVVSLSRQPSGTSLSPGSQVTYTVGVKNNSSVPILGGTLSDAFRPTPSAQSGITWTCTGSGGAVCPSASGTGSLPVVLNLPAGAQLNYTVKTTLPTAQMSMSVDYTVTATPPRGYLDTNPIDNVASNSVLIVPAGPDLVVTVTETKSPTDTTVSYAINVHNNGPGPADGATVTYDIPAGATLQAVSAGPGWTCLSTMQRVTCTRTAPIGANEDASPIVIKVLPPAGAQTIPVEVTVSGTDSQGSPVSDPDPSSNTVSRTTDVEKLRLSGGGLAFGCSVSHTESESAHAGTLALFIVLLCGSAFLKLRLRRRRAAQAHRSFTWVHCWTTFRTLHANHDGHQAIEGSVVRGQPPRRRRADSRSFLDVRNQIDLGITGQGELGGAFGNAQQVGYFLLGERRSGLGALDKQLDAIHKVEVVCAARRIRNVGQLKGQSGQSRRVRWPCSARLGFLIEVDLQRKRTGKEGSQHARQDVSHDLLFGNRLTHTEAERATA
jgi:uncharacterized repeat protein (TIGR01451 family)